VSPEESTNPLRSTSLLLAKEYSLPWWYLTALKWGIGYCTVSIITLPLANVFWLREIPLLSLFQIPKIFVASLNAFKSRRESHQDAGLVQRFVLAGLNLGPALCTGLFFDDSVTLQLSNYSAEKRFLNQPSGADV
jgi:hypothetical protein